MNILMVDKFYFIKGGAERYYFELKNVLELKGHKVIPFSMQHPDNFETEYEPFFVDNVDYGTQSVLQKLQTFPKASGRMFYSFHARKRLEQLIAREKPDIAHLHMIDHQLSPSILHTLKKYDIPVIQTIHQYKLVCPNYRLYNPRTGKVCEKCLSGNMLHPIIERCHKNSVVASTLVALESTFHRATQIYDHHIDLFHVPSYFMGNKMEEAGVGTGKIRHLFYTIQIQNYEPSYVKGEYLLYFGRLADEKGILALLQAAKAYPVAPLYIVGGGPQRETLEAFVNRHNLDQVKFLGLKHGSELKSAIQNARAIVVPSEWYDNSPLVIYESCAFGKPVIGARMGGIPELIDDGETGCIFEAGNVAQLAEQMQDLWEHPQKAIEFGRAARQKAENEFDPEVHYLKIFDWYQELAQTNHVFA